MYTNYTIWGGVSDGLVDDFFRWGRVIPIGRGKFFWGGDWTVQCNI